MSFFDEDNRVICCIAIIYDSIAYFADNIANRRLATYVVMFTFLYCEEFNAIAQYE
jgi:hypothetical protein